MENLISSITDFWSQILFSIASSISDTVIMDNPLVASFNLKIFGSTSLTFFDIILTLLVMLTMAWLIWFSIKVLKRVFNLFLRLVG